MAQLGTFILLFGWFGFNAASTMAVTDVQFAVVATNTAIAAAFGAVVAALYAHKRLGKPDPGMQANGMLAGLVAITAPCAFTTPAWSAVIGGVAAIIVIESCLFIEKRGIDDPVGAISVHGIGGTFGVLCVGLVANGSYGSGWNGSPLLEADGVTATPGVEGLFYGNAGQLGAQLVGIAVLWTVIFGIAFAFFKIQNALTKGGIRTPESEELEGLDMPEMGVLAYVHAPEEVAAALDRHNEDKVLAESSR